MITEKKVIRNLNIELIYSNEYNAYLFSELVSNYGKYTISPFNLEDIESLNDFYNAPIGIELIKDHIYSFCRIISMSAFDAIEMLLNSVCFSNFDVFSKISELRLLYNRFSPELYYEIIAYSTPLELHLHLDYLNKQIMIEFINNTSSINQHSRYFKNIFVPFNVWTAAAVVALEEYFSIFEKIFEDRIKGENQQEYILKAWAKWKILRSEMHKILPKNKNKFLVRGYEE